VRRRDSARTGRDGMFRRLDLTKTITARISGTLGDVLMPCTPRSNPDARGRDCGRLARSAPISFNPRRAMGPPVFLICLDKDSEAAHFRGCAWKRYGGVTVVNRSI